MMKKNKITLYLQKGKNKLDSSKMKRGYQKLLRQHVNRIKLVLGIWKNYKKQSKSLWAPLWMICSANSTILWKKMSSLMSLSFLKIKKMKKRKD